MAHIDRIPDQLSFLSSFFSGEAKTGRFEAVIVLLGCVAMAVGVILAGHMPSAMELAAP